MGLTFSDSFDAMTLVGHYYYTHFTEKELEAENVQYNEVTKLVNGGARILSKMSGSRVPTLNLCATLYPDQQFSKCGFQVQRHLGTYE